MIKNYKTYDDILNIISRFEDIIDRPDEIWAIGRGGAIPGVHLSHMLGVPLRVLNDDDVPLNVSPDFKILLVDDINDSGTTIVNIMRSMMERGVNLDNVQIATLYEKTSSTIRVDYAGETIPENEWIVFPWETADSDSVEEDESQPLFKCWMVRFI